MKLRHGRWVLLAALLLLAGGCRTHDPCDDCWEPPAPTGVWTITGDGYVEVLWDDLYIQDLDHYRVYRGDEEFGDYWHIGSSGDTYFVDDDVINGITYYYAVTAVDRNGRESDLSYATVMDTPRPAGEDLVVWDYDDEAGVDFSGYYHHMIRPWDDLYTDMYLVWDESDLCYAFQSTEGNDLQYAGWVENLDELDWAPEGGWSLGQTDRVNLYEGYAYWVWTWDNHFAKFVVTDIDYDDYYVVVDWAYQVDEGNPELSIVPAGGGERTLKTPIDRKSTGDKPAARSARAAADPTMAGRR